MDGEYDYNWTWAESESTNLPPMRMLKDLGILRKTEVLTKNGGFSFVILPWKSELEPEEKSDLLCHRLGAVGELDEQMDNGYFVMGGAEKANNNSASGVIVREEPLLYRPITLELFAKIRQEYPISKEGEDYLRDRGLLKMLYGKEMYLNAGEIQETSPVCEVGCYPKGSSAEQQLPIRIL